MFEIFKVYKSSVCSKSYCRFGLRMLISLRQPTEYRENNCSRLGEIGNVSQGRFHIAKSTHR